MQKIWTSLTSFAGCSLVRTKSSFKTSIQFHLTSILHPTLPRQALQMNPQATCQRHPTKHQRISSSRYRPWPSNSFKRMAPTDAPQEPEEPIACALLDEWLLQLFTHHELWSNLAAAVALCFRDFCGYSCKDVQTSRLTVRSCSLAWWLLDRHTCKDLQSYQRGDGPEASPPLDQSFGGCGPNLAAHRVNQ